MPEERAIESWSSRIAAEFRECPGLRLTAAQAARLWTIERVAAETILDGLVREAVLVLTPEGAYTRAGERRAATKGT